MKHIKKVFLPSLLLAICLYTLHVSACIHDQVQTDDIPTIDLSSGSPEGRMLAGYQPLRVYFDFSNLNLADSVLYDYIVNELIPPAKNYFYNTLKVPSSSTKFGIPGVSTICQGGITVPTLYQTTGVDADLVIFVTAAYESSASYVAYSMICLLDSDTHRPVGGRLHFNTAQVKQKNKESQREADLVTTMHELTHILGFSSSAYALYKDPVTGANRTGHTFDINVNGVTTSVVNVEPLTSKLKDYFQCNGIQGAYLENEGSSGSAGSHFERRIFYNEYMTASRLNDARISEFTLALLEGSGWYQVDYTMAEPMTWGKGKGCTFVNGPCVDTAVTPKVGKFPEFCAPFMERGCSWTGREGSMCGNFNTQTSGVLSIAPYNAFNWWGNYTVVADTYADNCPVFQPFSNTDCEDVENIATAKIAGSASGYGSKCFMGTLSTTGSPRPFGSYCFKPTCDSSSGSKVIKVQIAGTTATCTAEGSLTVSGYAGDIYCPDPETFCSVIENEGHCRRMCMGRGTCYQNECQCEAGWGSFDCGQRAYASCSRCSSDSNNPHCYGDTCGCDPNDSKCKGMPIGVIIAIAVGGALFLIALILTIKYRKAIMRKLSGKKASAPVRSAAPATSAAPKATRAAPPSLQPTNIQTRPVVSNIRRNLDRAPSHGSIHPEQKGDENITSPAVSPNSVRNIRVDFVDSRSNTITIRESSMRGFMGDRDKGLERISPKDNKPIKEQSGEASPPMSLGKLQSQIMGGGSQQNITSPKGERREQPVEGSKPSSLKSLKRLASQSKSQGGSQHDVK